MCDSGRQCVGEYLPYLRPFLPHFPSSLSNQVCVHRQPLAIAMYAHGQNRIP